MSSFSISFIFNLLSAGNVKSELMKFVGSSMNDDADSEELSEISSHCALECVIRYQILNAIYIFGDSVIKTTKTIQITFYEKSFWLSHLNMYSVGTVFKIR